MDEKAYKVLAGLMHSAPRPGQPMTADQLASVAAEVDRVLSEMAPAERAEFLSEVLQRASTGDPERDLLLKSAGLELGLSQLVAFVLTGVDTAPPAGGQP